MEPERTPFDFVQDRLRTREESPREDSGEWLHGPRFVKSLFCIAIVLITAGALRSQPYLGNGIKIGEVSATTAIIWVRLTETAEPNRDGITWGTGDVPHREGNPNSPDRAKMEGSTSDDPFWYQVPEGKNLWDMSHSLQGAPGNVNVTLTSNEGGRRRSGGPVKPEHDHVRQFLFKGLSPNARYDVEIEAQKSDGTATDSIETSFLTAPDEEHPSPVSFAVVTGARWKTMDHPDGHNIYVHMKALEPNFFVHTGDIVYYDHLHPYATHKDLARFRWHRMYSLPRIIAFHNQVPSYFIRDDHDTWQNDCWPGMTPRMGNFTLADGQAVFREQAPMSEKTYRTFRWGKDLQVWMTEGRDYRSPNTMPDGPGKTIWGADQMAWFKRTVAASDATFRILISPSPVVGPDHEGKLDNHSNKNFTYEGDLIRTFMADHDMIVVCGDRHWQYTSEDTRTGLPEYSCGPTTDKHATEIVNDDLSMIKYVAAIGGFLHVTVERVDGSPRAVFRHYDVDGQVVNEEMRVRN